MNTYYLYLVIASATIASPGPGVVMTLTNSLKYGLKNSLSGILGVTLGMFIIANIVGGGLGILILSSEKIFFLLKMLGAMYLLYLGIKLIINRNKELSVNIDKQILCKKKSFFSGLGITLINPKPILFFMALFPQFINNDSSYLPQFILLTMTFCILIIIIHSIYGIFASFIKKNTNSRNVFKYINLFGGSAYILFSISLIVLNR